MKTLNEYLQEIHALDYIGTDDEMSDSYEDWLSEQDIEDILVHAQHYADDMVSNQKEFTNEIIKTVANNI